MNEQLILDRYRLIERLAVGGSAEVWRAHDVQLDREVAVKRLHPHLLPDEASRLRLAAEARAAASLSHPVIVDIYDVDATGEAPALVMELVDGESLSARLDRGGPMTDREAAAVTADVAEALYHAHQRGVIHRDVKPGNVLLGKDGRTRLVDFGIAHSLAEASERLTVTGTVIGTLRSMAPEQLAAGPITPRTDLYGLGVVLHEALTGRSPYTAASPVALADEQRAGLPNLDGIEPALASVLASSLAYDPADRPLHAGAMASALRDWLAGDSSAALAMPPASAASYVDTAEATQPMAAVSPAPAVAHASAVARPRRRLPLVLLGALAASLLLVGAAVVVSGLGPGPDTIGGPPATATATATPIPTATPAPPPPEWLAGLVERVAKDCGDELADEARAVMIVMSEDEAKDHADEQARACKASEDGGGGDGDRGGNGRGDENGNSRGNDD
ncbi:MAG: serine/threonine protein kinase [Chloroflexota bacterium]|nr:serine/threonine protein kinase [Chloroflexota bacterium]